MLVGALSAQEQISTKTMTMKDQQEVVLPLLVSMEHEQNLESGSGLVSDPAGRAAQDGSGSKERGHFDSFLAKLDEGADSVEALEPHFRASNNGLHRLRYTKFLRLAPYFLL